MTRKSRPVSWIKAALKVFENFPDEARSICLAALTVAAVERLTSQRRCTDWDPGCSNLEYGSAATLYRVVYTLQLTAEVWVVHAFQKKSTQGIKTPQREINVIWDRLKRLKEMLR